MSERNFQQEIYPSQTREALRKNPNAKEVAEELGLHIATVYRHAEGMDLKIIRNLKNLGFQITHAIIYLNMSGVPNKKIAEIFGVTLPYVTGVLKDLIKPEVLRERIASNG